MLLEQRFPGATTCIVVGGLGPVADADFSGFSAMLWYSDDAGSGAVPAGMSPGTVRALGVAGLKPGEVVAAVEEFIGRDPRHMPSIFVTTAALASNAIAHELVLRQVHGLVEINHRERMTRQRDAFQWQRNLLNNLQSYGRRRIPASWAGALAGTPAFVCGVGPSLEASVGRLAEEAARGVLIASDLALHALDRSGVAADIAVSIDVGRTPEKCLPRERLPGRLLLSPVSPPTWTQSVPPERVIFVSNGQVTLDWLGGMGIARTPFTATETFGSTGLELARFLGCAPIYLFGMDLALDPALPLGRRAGEADAAPTGEDFDPELKMPRVPANFGGEIPTHIYGCWRALTARLAQLPAGLVRNVNDRGALLANTTLVRPDRFAIDGAPRDKAQMRALLAPPDAPSEAVLAAAMRVVAREGAVGLAAVPGLRSALREGGAPAAAAALGLLFKRPDFARMMGAFSLKMIPHLFQSAEGALPLWKELIDETEELARVAESAGRV
jgi:hypothetical protein